MRRHRAPDAGNNRISLKGLKGNSTLISREVKTLAVKDEYTFDFLELADEYSERQLEQAILAKVEPFLLEMGGMFSFIGSQYRLEVGGKEYFVDLLLFHRRL